MTRMARRTITDPLDKQLDAHLNFQETAWHYGTEKDLESANQLILDALRKRLPTPSKQPQKIDPVRHAFDQQREAFRTGDQERIERANAVLLDINQNVLTNKGPTAPRP